MGIGKIEPVRGTIQTGSGNTPSLQGIATTAAGKSNHKKKISSFTGSIEHYPSHQHRPDVRRILELAKSDPTLAVEFIELLAQGKPLPEAQDKNSGRKAGETLASPQQK